MGAEPAGGPEIAEIADLAARVSPDWMPCGASSVSWGVCALGGTDDLVDPPAGDCVLDTLIAVHSSGDSLRRDSTSEYSLIFMDCYFFKVEQVKNWSAYNRVSGEQSRKSSGSLQMTSCTGKTETQVWSWVRGGRELTSGMVKQGLALYER